MRLQKYYIIILDVNHTAIWDSTVWPKNVPCKNFQRRYVQRSKYTRMYAEQRQRRLSKQAHTSTALTVWYYTSG